MNAPRNEDLLRRTKRFALRVVKVCVAMPKNPVATALAVQLVKAGTSPGANYREAHRARSKAEFAAKIGDASRNRTERFTGWKSSRNPASSPLRACRPL